VATFPIGTKNFLYSRIYRPAMESTHSPTKMVQKSVSPMIKRPGSKAGQLLSSSVEVLNQCNYAPPPPPPYMAS